MRSRAAITTGALMFACIAACATPDDSAYVNVSLQPPYSQLPMLAAGAAIEAGTTIALDAGQQEAVVVGVRKWLKTPGSAQFGVMAAARNARGTVTVCGYVTGRNGAGAYAGMAPYVGVMMGSRSQPDFVVVGIGGSARERGEVTALCRESGIALVA